MNKSDTYTVKLTVRVNAAAGSTIKDTASTVSNTQDFVKSNNTGTVTTKVDWPDESHMARFWGGGCRLTEPPQSRGFAPLQSGSAIRDDSAQPAIIGDHKLVYRY